MTIARSSWGEGCLIRCPEHVTYDISRTCNHWTAEALAAAGLWVDAGRVPTAAGLIRQATTGANGFRLIWDPELREDR